ncbi:MAG: GTPase domain-containing protein [Promethearchaeota archaeon]
MIKIGKKIIFVGPPNAGKTTLRKVFFEGESSSKLLEYALDPTYGEESLILRLPGLNEDIGIFDLAGQENKRWLETDEKRIFYDTKLILVVIDIKSNNDEIINFVRKVIDLRNDLTPSTFIFVLLHKIDLVSEKKIREIRSIIKNSFSNDTLINFRFTSLKKEYFHQTFSYFIEIMKTCLQDVLPNEGLLLNMVDESLKIIHQIDKNVIIAKDILYEKLNRPEKLVNYLVENLINKGHIEVKEVKNESLLSLTNKGKVIYKKVLENFFSVSNDKDERNFPLLEIPTEEKNSGIIGAIISDKDGLSLLNFELYDNAIKDYISQSVPNDDSIIPIDLELIPMFISALEKFSLELNIQDLTGFGLRGSNLKMHIFSYNNYTVTLFMNPNINLEAIENKINNYFRNLFDEYKDKFEMGLNTGKIDDLLPIGEIGRNWLEELNTFYQRKIINSEIIDKNQAQLLYSNIDKLYEDINKEFSITLEKIKKLKVDIMKSIIEKDYEELNKMANIAQELKLKFCP